MASVSTSHLILFIASLIIAASVAGTFMSGVERLSGALGDRSIDVSGEIETDVEIISDPASGAVYNATGNENVTLLVKNTGSTDLQANKDQIEVLLDGKYQSDVSMKVVDGPAWGVGNVARVNISTSGISGDHRVKLTVNSDEEVLEFRT